MEEPSKRRKRIKKIAVVFFLVMMILTFFSNTIMNYSLAQVSTEQVTSDTVSSKVRGTGNVEAGMPIEIKLKESREVTEVLVQAGDEVKKGEVLLTLKEGAGAETEAAENELKSQREAYDDYLLTSEIDAQLIAKAENGGIDRQEASGRLEALRAAVREAEQKAEELQKVFDAIDNGTDEQAVVLKTVTKETEAAGKALLQAQTVWEALGLEETDISGQTEHLSEEEHQKAQEAWEAYQAAKNLYDQKMLARDQLSESLEERKDTLSLQLAQANESLKKANTEHEEYLTQLNTIKSVKEMYDALREKEKEVEKLKLVNAGNELKAPADGKIVSVDIEKGEMTQPETALITMQDAAGSYTLSISVPKEQAAKVKKGEEASVSEAWYYDDLSVILREIKSDPENPAKNRRLVFSVEGDVEAGQSLSVSVGEKSTRYDLVVPNGAVREDTNGKFILIIREKNSPLGNRYIATRVNVEIIKQDDNKSALKAALEGYEYVITNASKMVKEGDYVRLAK